MRSFATLVLATCVLGIFGTAQAQSFGTEAISIVVSPQYPRPFQTVTITPRSTLLNLASSEITITANGAVIEKGSGERSVDVVMGAPGSSTTIRVTATQGGTSESAEVTLRPTDVSLVVEPLTTGHPLYDGGLLVAPEGMVRLVALTDFRNTNGARIPSSALSYTWRVGNRILTEESGIGRSVLTATAPVQYRTSGVSVTVSTTNETMSGYAATEVSPATSNLLVYRADPLLGIDLAHALSGTVALLGEENTFAAVPFNFTEEPNLTWAVNNAVMGNDSTLTLRAQTEGSARASVNVSATGATGESARSAFEVTFVRAQNVFGF